MIKNNKCKTISSKIWMDRQIKDPYVNLRHKLGYRSRSFHKLIEIEKKFNLFKVGSRVLDLGAAPGSWSQVAAKLTNSTPKNPVISIDLLPISPIYGVYPIQGSFEEAKEYIKEIYPKNKINLIMSDIAPKSCGISSIDHLRLNNILYEVIEIFLEDLNFGGTLILKAFQGKEEKNIREKLKQNFNQVSYFKPISSRRESREIYLIARAYNNKGIVK